ncbi:MAG: hypothetical protein IKO83_04920 [Oscillospiraceae bacterium]|nr:hypothetical protein [Oscillospiraceae bacterium]
MQERDFAWFVKNMPSLYKKYGDCFLAIKSETVLGSYQSYASAVNETRKSEPLGTFIVQQCGSDETAYTCYISSINFAM